MRTESEIRNHMTALALQRKRTDHLASALGLTKEIRALAWVLGDEADGLPPVWEGPEKVVYAALDGNLWRCKIGGPAWEKVENPDEFLVERSKQIMDYALEKIWQMGLVVTGHYDGNYRSEELLSTDGHKSYSICRPEDL